MSLSIAPIMDALALTLVNGSVVTVAHAWPIGTFTPPCAVVGYPSAIDFDLTFKRGGDTVVFPVWLIAGASVDEATRAVLSAFIDGTVGVKQVLEADGSLGGVIDTLRVTDAAVELISQDDGSTFWAVRLDVEVIA